MPKRLRKGYKPRGKKTMDSIPEEKEVPSIRFTNFTTEMSDEFLQRYMRRPMNTNMRYPLEERLLNAKCTNDLLSSAKLLVAPRLPSLFPNSYMSFKKRPFFPDESRSFYTSLGFQKGMGGRETNVMLKEVFASDLIYMKQYQPNQFREILSALTMELYILFFLQHKNFLTPLKVYTEPLLGRYHIAFTPHVPMRLIMDEIERQYQQDFYFGSDEIPAYVTQEVLRGLYYLQRNRLSHNFVCAQTVYVNASGNVRIGDFEKCKQNMPDSDTHQPLKHLINIGTIAKYEDLHSLGCLYTKMCIPDYLKLKLFPSDFESHSLLNSAIKRLVHKLNNRIKIDPYIPMSEDQIDFLVACFSPKKLPVDLLSHPYLAHIPADRREMLRQVVQCLKLDLKNRVITGPVNDPPMIPTEITPFRRGRPHVEFNFKLEEQGTLNTFNRKFIIDPFDNIEIMNSLYNHIINSKRTVTIRGLYNFEPPDVLKIRVEMNKLIQNLDNSYSEWLMQDENLRRDIIRSQSTIRLGADGSRILSIIADLRSINEV